MNLSQMILDWNTFPPPKPRIRFPSKALLFHLSLCLLPLTLWLLSSHPSVMNQALAEGCDSGESESSGWGGWFSPTSETSTTSSPQKVLELDPLNLFLSGKIDFSNSCSVTIMDRGRNQPPWVTFTWEDGGESPRSPIGFAASTASRKEGLYSLCSGKGSTPDYKLILVLHAPANGGDITGSVTRAELRSRNPNVSPITCNISPLEGGTQ